MKLNFRQSVFYRIFLFILCPALIIVIISLSIYGAFSSDVEKQILEEYEISVERSGRAIKTLFDEFFFSGILLAEVPAMREIMVSSAEDIKDLNSLDLVKITDSLTAFSMSRKTLDSLFIYHRPSGMVFSSSGSSAAGLFFDRLNSYADYKRPFWDDLLDRMRPGKFALFPGTAVDQDGQIRQIVPLVQKGLGNIASSHSLLVMNLDAGQFGNWLNTYKLTRGSVITLLKDGEVLSSTSPEFPASGPVYRIERKINLNFMVLDLVFEIPESDIRDRQKAIRTLVFTILPLLALFCIIGAFFLSRILYKPIKHVIALFQQSGKLDSLGSGNEFDYLRDKYADLTESLTATQASLATTLPVVYERYILRIVRVGEYHLFNRLMEYGREQGIPLNHDCFLCALTSVFFEKEVKEHLSTNEINRLMDHFLKLQSRLPLSHYIAFRFIFEGNKILTVFNVPSDFEPSGLIASYRQYHNIMAEEHENILFTTLIGRSGSGPEGLKQSFDEASGMLFKGTMPVKNAVLIYEERGEKRYYLPVNLASNLENFLFIGESDKTFDLLGDVLKKNKERSLLPEQQMELLSLLHQIGEKALQRQGRSAEEVMAVLFKPGELLFKESRPDIIEEYLFSFYERIGSVPLSTGKVEIQEVVKYINKHYRDPGFYLEGLASDFGVSYKYMSRLFKSAMDISFQVYLNQLRIIHAKELLISTEKTIEDIGLASGFSSANTFYRLFKKYEGLTPSQFRHSVKRQGRKMH